MTDYYQKHYKEYHEKTFHVDPSSFLEPFIKYVEPGKLVLGVGCGSGRDLLWLKNRGYEVIGFERSAGLAELARENVGCEVIEGDFETYDFSKISVDAILMSGSLVHIQHEKLGSVIQNITKALHLSQYPGNVFITLKEGEGSWTDDQNRVFYLWKDKDLRVLFNGLGFNVLHFSKNESILGSGDVWLGYVLQK